MNLFAKSLTVFTSSAQGDFSFRWSMYGSISSSKPSSHSKSTDFSLKIGSVDQGPHLSLLQLAPAALSAPSPRNKERAGVRIPLTISRLEPLNPALKDRRMKSGAKAARTPNAGASSWRSNAARSVWSAGGFSAALGGRFMRGENRVGALMASSASLSRLTPHPQSLSPLRGEGRQIRPL